MDPSELGDLVRAITTFFAVVVGGFWAYIGWRAKSLNGSITLSPTAIYAFTAFFLLLAGATVVSLFQRQGQSINPVLLAINIAAILLMIGLTAAVMLGFRGKRDD